LGPQPDLPIETRHGLGVVIEHIGTCFHHDFDGGAVALKIGNQNFDTATRNALANGADGEGEEFGAAIGAIIAVHTGDHGETQSHDRDGFSNPPRLVVIHRQWRALFDGAETAAACTHVAQDHECRGAMIPAFADIGASRALTNRVEAKALDQVFELVIILSRGRRRAEPGGPLEVGSD